MVRNIIIKCGSKVWDKIGKTYKQYAHILKKVINTVKFIYSTNFDTSKLQYMSPRMENNILNMKQASTEKKQNR